MMDKKTSHTLKKLQ